MRDEEGEGMLGNARSAMVNFSCANGCEAALQLTT